VAEPPEKELSILSFVAHATRGVIRDRAMRRQTMFVVLVVALALLFSGTTFLQITLNPRDRPVWFILFWTACGWLTLTALLLAVFDLLMARMEARKAARHLREKFAQSQFKDSPRSTIRE
jgi:cytochrome bd-type quinol oxidase subunit 2